MCSDPRFSEWINFDFTGYALVVKRKKGYTDRIMCISPIKNSFFAQSSRCSTCRTNFARDIAV